MAPNFQTKLSSVERELWSLCAECIFPTIWRLHLSHSAAFHSWKFQWQGQVPELNMSGPPLLCHLNKAQWQSFNQWRLKQRRQKHTHTHTHGPSVAQPLILRSYTAQPRGTPSIDRKSLVRYCFWNKPLKNTEGPWISFNCSRSYNEVIAKSNPLSPSWLQDEIHLWPAPWRRLWIEDNWGRRWVWVISKQEWSCMFLRYLQV